MANDLAVSLVTAVCILALAVVPKWILDVQLDVISQYAPVWVYIVYVISRGRGSQACRNPRYWSLAIALVTLAVLVIYAL
jgi:hypothetical protein